MTRRVSMLLSASVGIVALLACVWMVRADAPSSQPAAAGPGELAVVKTFPADGNDRWDYLTVDPQARRVYVSRSTHVMVLDADSGKVIGEVADTPGVHGIALVPERNEGFTSNGKAGTLSVFDLKTFETVRTIKAGANPDAILYDPASGKVFAFNGKSGDATVVDTQKPEAAPATLAIGGKLEYGVADGAGHVYVNVEDKSELVAIDSKELKVLAHWLVAPGAEPTGLAMDAAHRRLFVGCSNQKMIVLDADSGKVLADLPIGSGVDGVAFDAELNLAMSANGRDGTLTAVREGPDGKFTVVQTLPTVKSARTLAADPKTHRAYLPAMIPGEDGQTKFGLVVVGRSKPQ